MIFNFIVERDYENISTTKFSKFTVLQPSSASPPYILPIRPLAIAIQPNTAIIDDYSLTLTLASDRPVDL